MSGRRAHLRHSAKRDANEGLIVEALEAQGFSVKRLNGKGVPDLLVGKRGFGMRLVEVKAKGGTFTPAQVAWRQTWTGPQPITLRSVDDAMAFMLLACEKGTDAETR